MKSLFREKVYSRWLILLIDQILLIWALSFSLLFIDSIAPSKLLSPNYISYILLFSCIATPVFMTLQIHTGIIRYSNTKDMFRIFIAVLACSLIFALAHNLYRIIYLKQYEIWVNPVLLLNFFISSSLLILLRISVKGLYAYFQSFEVTGKENILIYGSDASSMLLKQALEASKGTTFQVIAYIDDNADKVNKYIEQTKVQPFSNLELLKRKHSIEKMIMDSEVLTDDKKQVIEKCIELGIKVMTVPPSKQWLSGKFSLNQLQNLKIEDLLQREPILLQSEYVLEEISGKRILVTGAAGSIGSEIVRQLLQYNPKQVVLCDQAETPLHELQLEIEDLHQNQKVALFMANIQNYSRMQHLFETFKPQLVFHAAACKHVPMMENNPAEAILTNIMGTKNLSDLSLQYEVEKFLMISTDKAVNPTNVMGATKRMAEIYIQALNAHPLKHQKTSFITTRFGNVMGSNGSVIPRFKSQIEKGGPITVTHPEITRYFMTIPESVQLVLEAAAMGKGAEIFLFDMGEPVKILDLALKMIRLCGLSPATDIKIVYCGLRPGEKLHEELLHEDEQTIATHHHKIKISKTIPYNLKEIQLAIDELLKLNNFHNNEVTVKKLKELIPEYKSNNSIYEYLDATLTD